MIGNSLLHYKITAKLGEGGMGAVYRAQDSKLNRDVALKLLPQAFAKDAERLARFQREARTLASLSHPNIAPIFDYIEADGECFLVMELIEGDDLSQRMLNGPIPVDEALHLAQQIAEGLKAAHDKGIVHRDLKPANIKITADGNVRILDFGLARAYEERGDNEIDSQHSPTITALHTQAGIIIGTAAYMSPEQARGLPVDKRTDIWAFGVVLFEMLTGKQLFEGGTISDKLASILKSPPDWELLPSNTPPRIRELLERCLAKRRSERMQDIGDVRLEIDWTLQGRTSVPVVEGSTAKRLPLWPTILATLLLAVVIATATWKLSSNSAPNTTDTANALRTRHLSLEFPADLLVQGYLVAPDGTLCIAARSRQSGTDTDNLLRLYTRRVDDYEFRVVPGSAGAEGFCFSHDSRWIAMLAPDGSLSSNLHLWKVPVAQDSPALRLLSWPDEWTSALHWLRSGDLVASTHTRELVRNPTDGRTQHTTVAIQSIGFEEGFDPSSRHGTELPDGIHILNRVETWGEDGYAQQIAVANIETGEAKVVLKNASNPQWLDSGHLIFSRGPTILAVRFDPVALEVLGGPIAVGDGLRTLAAWAHGGFGLSADGSLYHVPGGLVGQKRQLAWTDRRFHEFTPWSDELRPFEGLPSISTDDRSVAAVIAGPDGVFEIWISEVERPGLRRFVFEKGRDCTPLLWTEDGSQLLFFSFSPGSHKFMAVAVDGSTPARLLFEVHTQTERYEPTSFADDDKLLLVTHSSEGKNEILLHPFAGTSGTVPTQRLLADAANGKLSPDGKWLAYDSRSSGRDEVYVRRWLGGGELGREIRVSTEGGSGPFWYRESADGPLEIWYGRNRTIYSSTFTSEPEPRLDRPRFVVELTTRLVNFHKLSDGRILAHLGGEDEEDPGRLHVVLNWQNDIQRLLSASP